MQTLKMKTASAVTVLSICVIGAGGINAQAAVTLRKQQAEQQDWGASTMPAGDSTLGRRTKSR